MIYFLIDENHVGVSYDGNIPTGAVECSEDVYQNHAGYSVSDGVLVSPTDAYLLAKAQTEKITSLSAACQTYLLAGFTSSALGSTHNYPSTLTDQQNQASVAASGAGGSLWCETGSIWGFMAHTDAQATQVVTDWKTYLNAAQTKLQTLAASVNAATTVAAVQVISW